MSANVGDQFGPRNKHLLEKVFGWFYFSINFGSFFSTLLTPVLLDHFSRTDLYGATCQASRPGGCLRRARRIDGRRHAGFLAGTQEVRPHSARRQHAWCKEAFSREGAKVIAKLGVLFLFVAMFWALYEQTGAAWVLQAEKMDRHLLAWFQPVEQWLVAAGVGFVDGLSAV